MAGSYKELELYGLSTQMRRAAVSVASNIAEGKGRSTDKEFASLPLPRSRLLIELETQIVIARELGYLPVVEADRLDVKTELLAKAIHALLNVVRGEPASRPEIIRKEVLANSKHDGPSNGDVKSEVLAHS